MLAAHDQALSVCSLDDIGCLEELAETSDTIRGNALQKAAYVHKHYGVDVFAEDTGLEVLALNSEPGVQSARYAGPARDPEKNMDLLLSRLQSKDDRRARFLTVIALILADETYLFEGVVNGVIVHERQGQGGFGYDPLFQPDGHRETFGQLSPEIKNSISHRSRALAKMLAFLSQRDR